MRPFAACIFLLVLVPSTSAQLPSLDGATLFIEQFGTVDAASSIDGNDDSGFARTYEHGFHYIWNMTVTLDGADGVYHGRGLAWVSVDGEETEVYEGYDESKRVCSVEFIDEWAEGIAVFVDGPTLHYAHDVDSPEDRGTCSGGGNWGELALGFHAMDLVEEALAGELPYDGALRLGLVDSFEEWGHSALDNAGTVYYEGYGRAAATLGRQAITVSKSYGLGDYLEGPALFPCGSFYADELQGMSETGQCTVVAKTTLDIQPSGVRALAERADPGAGASGADWGTDETPGPAVAAALVGIAAAARLRRRA